MKAMKQTTPPKELLCSNVYNTMLGWKYFANMYCSVEKVLLDNCSCFPSVFLYFSTLAKVHTDASHIVISNDFIQPST